MKDLYPFHRRCAIAAVLALLAALNVVSAESPHDEKIAAFLKAHPDALPLIVIKNGEGDFSNWERFEAEVIDGDHIHVPKTNPRTKQEFGDFKLIFEFKVTYALNRIDEYDDAFLNVSEDNVGEVLDESLSVTQHRLILPPFLQVDL